MTTLITYLASLILPMLVRIQPSLGAENTQPILWDLKSLSKPPGQQNDPSRSVDGVQALFYEGLPWKGKPTRVFAYFGVPKLKPGAKAPAMVLVHGGGGSAFIPWVKLWVSRGYAAIAMDTCGCVSGGGYENHPRHVDGGPPGWGGFDQLDDDLRDQWTYHAVADVILANSLLRSFPEIDSNRIGLTGISWGGYLACITAGVDQRFKFVAPVYGCGFLGDNSVWVDTFRALGEEKAKKWLGLWDPSVYLSRAKMPMLWVTGTTDFAYPMDSLQKSYNLPRSVHTLCVRVGMAHGHGGPGENPEEIHAMADAVLKGGSPLARITSQGRTGEQVWVCYQSRQRVSKVELNYTVDLGHWQTRIWKTDEAEVVQNGGRATVLLPRGATVYFFNVIDERGRAVSSEHIEVQRGK